MANQIALGMKQKKKKKIPHNQLTKQWLIKSFEYEAWCNYTLTHFLPDCQALSYLEGLECNMLTNMNTKMVKNHMEQNLDTVFMYCSVSSFFLYICT